jgi:hypothetical protein
MVIRSPQYLVFSVRMTIITWYHDSTIRRMSHTTRSPDWMQAALTCRPRVGAGC